MSTDVELNPALSDDPNAEMRHPLTVLICLLPLSILGELYRWIILRRQQELLADDVWQEAATHAGITPLVIPSVLLAIGCIAWIFISKKSWTFPTIPVITRVVAWSIVWCFVRSVISFTNEGLQSDSVGPLGTLGLCVSGAVHEEIIFRAIGIGVCAWFISLVGIPMRWTVWIMLPISALLFSLAHTHIMNSNIPPETWNPAIVVEHCIAGLIYGYVFIRQGLAVSTLTHFFFNTLMVSGALGGF